MGRTCLNKCHPERTTFSSLFFICIEIYMFRTLESCSRKEEYRLTGIIFIFENKFPWYTITGIFTRSGICIAKPWYDFRREEKKYFPRMSSLEMYHLMSKDKFDFFHIIVTRIDDTCRENHKVSWEKMCGKSIKHTIHIIEVYCRNTFHAKFFCYRFSYSVYFWKLLLSDLYTISLDIWEKYRMSDDYEKSKYTGVKKPNSKCSNNNQYPKYGGKYDRKYPVWLFFWMYCIEIVRFLKYYILHNGVFRRLILLELRGACWICIFHSWLICKCSNRKEYEIQEDKSYCPPSTMSCTLRDTMVDFDNSIDVPERDKKSENPPIRKSCDFYEIENIQHRNPREPAIF